MRHKGLLQFALVGVLHWSLAGAQDNTTCTADSCGVSSCDAGFELEVTVASDSLVISCNPCDEDYYKADESSEACTPCAEGLVADGGATVCTLEEGFWRTSNVSQVTYECPNTDACAGGSDPATYCSEGFEGPHVPNQECDQANKVQPCHVQSVCAVCTGDYYPSGSYECLYCTRANAVGTVITIIIFVGVVVLFLVLVTKAAETVIENTDGAALDDEANDNAASAFETASGNTRLMQFIKKWKDTLVVRLKIIVAHFQVVSAFPKVLDVQWPDAFDRYADKMSVFNLDIWGILTQGCYFQTDFLYQLVFTTVLPLAIIAVLLCYYFKKTRRGSASVAAKQAAWDFTAGGVLLTCFFFYIITSTVVLKSFDCKDFDDGTSFLKADFSISCGSRRYDAILWYAIIMVIIFPVGIPVMYLATLIRRKKQINPDPLNFELSVELRQKDPTIQKTKFLWGTYRPSVYYYEVWECVRKLLLTGLLVYFEEGTSTQVVVAIIVTLTGLRVLSGLRPYIEEDENALAEASLWITFLTLFVALLIKAEVADEDGYDSTALGVLLSVMNLALIGLAAFQILYETSVWFSEKCGFCFGGSEGEYQARQSVSKHGRRTRPRQNNTTSTINSRPQPSGQDKLPRPTQRTTREANGRSAQRPNQTEDSHPMERPSWGGKPLPVERPVRTGRPTQAVVAPPREDDPRRTLLSQSHEASPSPPQQTQGTMNTRRQVVSKPETTRPSSIPHTNEAASKLPQVPTRPEAIRPQGVPEAYKAANEPHQVASKPEARPRPRSIAQAQQTAAEPGGIASKPEAPRLVSIPQAQREEKGLSTTPAHRTNTRSQSLPGDSQPEGRSMGTSRSTGSVP